MLILALEKLGVHIILARIVATSVGLDDGFKKQLFQ
jgi:hypothetical protein